MVRNHTPINAPTNFWGANFVTVDRPMGDKHNSPHTNNKYPNNNHSSPTRPVSLARYDPNANTKKFAPINSKPIANFTVVGGFFFVLLNQIHNIEKRGDSKITNNPINELNIPVGIV